MRVNANEAVILPVYLLSLVLWFLPLPCPCLLSCSCLFVLALLARALFLFALVPVLAGGRPRPLLSAARVLRFARCFLCCALFGRGSSDPALWYVRGTRGLLSPQPPPQYPLFVGGGFVWRVWSLRRRFSLRSCGFATWGGTCSCAYPSRLARALLPRTYHGAVAPLSLCRVFFGRCSGRFI